MEKLMAESSHRGTTIESDSALRITRPSNTRIRTGQLAQDFGSSGFASRSSQNSNEPSTGRWNDKGRAKRGFISNQRKTPIDISDSDEDELDVLSRASSECELDKELSKPFPSSQIFSLDPEHQAAKSKTLKSLRFKKTRSENDNAIPSTSRMPNSSVLEPKSPNLSNANRLPSLTKPLSKASSESRKSPRKAPRQTSVEIVSERRVPRSTRRDRPVDEGRKASGSNRESEGKQMETEVTVLSKKGRPKPKPLPVKSSSRDVSDNVLLRPPVGKLKPVARFPVQASPANTPKKDPKPHSVEPRTFPVAAASPETVETHPSFSNTKVADFPLSLNDSPPGKAHALESSQEGSGIDGKHRLKSKSRVRKVVAVSNVAPFPVECSQSASKPRKAVGKRPSNASPQDDASPLKRQRLNDDDVQSSSPPSIHESDDSDDDDYFYRPNVDANTLCPYCDEPLPPSPTPHLKNLLVTTAKKSVRAPRPTNPMGRKAAVTLFIIVCQRHRFESKILPEAETKGWPKSIEWDQIHNRVMRMRAHLEALMENLWVESLTGDSLVDGDDDLSGVSSQRSRARDQCFFWKEIMEEIKEKGTRATANVKSQFANFQNAQPGYYGELGSVLIHQSLYDLFPPETTHPDLVAPLSPKEFINRVLLPEVALRLIMEDKSLSGPSGAREALEILRDSTSYGVMMFPEDTGERGKAVSAKDDPKGKGKRKGKEKERNQPAFDSNDESFTQMNVADRMVREKARRRRLELEKEQEDLMLHEQEQTMEHGARERKSKRKKLPKLKPRPKPRAIQKNASTSSLAYMDVASEPEDTTGFSDSGLDMNESDLDDVPLDAFANDGFSSSKDDDYLSPSNSASGFSLPPPSSFKPSSAGSMSISDDDAMVTTTVAENPGSNATTQKRRKQPIGPARTRSPSIEISSRDSEPRSRTRQSTFDPDDTPRASKPKPSLFSSTHAIPMSSRGNKQGSADHEGNRQDGFYRDLDAHHWNNDPDIAPLAFSRSRSKAKAVSSNAEKDKNRREKSTNFAHSTVKRTDSMSSDPSWLLSD
ncbi:RTC4-like domain-containing protein [Lentinula raphanica]|uniref:Restriction of telomere capping protein 4 n=1 Tax=Lentinula raphanica TaxID=153919 RepID=A0AA38UFB0_9AGAR|nr:RTC4-like domain-containing protein [Lentinula raphanica]